MSKSITEKELAEKVTDIYHEGSDLEAIMRNIARAAAELLGYEFAPEKPEPGTWHVTRTEGYPAYVEWDGDLIVFEPGALDHYLALANDWPDLDPALTPARVAPAAPVELSEEDLNDAYPTGEPNAYGDFYAFGKYDRRALLRMCQNLVDKHGHGRVEVSRDDVQAAADRALERTRGWTYARSADVTDLMMELLEGSK